MWRPEDDPKWSIKKLREAADRPCVNFGQGEGNYCMQ